jgi:hypothetical protein
MTAYADAAMTYLSRGWAPLPLPAGRKSSPPDGWTGHGAPWPSGADVAEWAANGHGSGNIGIRMPDVVVGIDVDDYDDKGGGETLANLEARLGQLPPSPKSTSRPDDPVSGIRFYRVPGGRRWHDPGPGIEVIQHTYRYAVVAPSIHPEGRSYLWYDPDGAQIPGPAVDELPELPESWVDDLSVVAAGRHTGRWSQLDREALDSRDLAALQALEALGGHGAYQADGYVAITRPGKVAGTSASIGHIGPGLVRVFTPNWSRLENGRVYEADELGAPGTSETLERRVVLTLASDIPIRRVRWLWNARLALGILALLAGREGLGKSTFAYWLVARITRGELLGEYQGQQRGVLICATEDSWEHVIVPRLQAAGADLGRVYRIEVRTADDITVGLSLPRDLRDIEVAARQAEAALMLLDPLMSRISDRLDPHKDLEVRQALEPLTWIANRVGMTILGIIHLNKTGSVDILDRVMGSKAFTAVARAVCAVVPDPDDEAGHRRLFGVPKNNLGRSDLPSIRFTVQGALVETLDGPSETAIAVLGDETETSIHEAMERSGEDADVRTQVADCKTWLREYLTENSHSDSRDVKRAAASQGFSESTLRWARKSLRVVVTNLSTSPRRTVWSLPESVVSIPRGEFMTDTIDINAGQRPVSDLSSSPIRVNGVNGGVPREDDTTGSHCIDCAKPYPAWILAKRDGRCVRCHNPESGAA